MKGYGRWLQLSVFQCRLTKARAIRLKADLEELVHRFEDHVVIVDLGPADKVKPPRPNHRRRLRTHSQKTGDHMIDRLGFFFRPAATSPRSASSRNRSHASRGERMPGRFASVFCQGMADFRTNPG